MAFQKVVMMPYPVRVKRVDPAMPRTARSILSLIFSAQRRNTRRIRTCDTVP